MILESAVLRLAFKTVTYSTETGQVVRVGFGDADFGTTSYATVAHNGKRGQASFFY